MEIRPARPEDAEALNDALARLSAEIGDPHRATAADIARHGFGPGASFRAAIGREGERIAGAVLVSPVYSTMRGAPGAFVSDLWVEPFARGSGLGRRLLVAARDIAAEAWGARFLRLTVYESNEAARAFYERLGFRGDAREMPLTLAGPALDEPGERS